MLALPFFGGLSQVGIVGSEVVYSDNTSETWARRAVERQIRRVAAEIASLLPPAESSALQVDSVGRAPFCG